jgi:hypothetical protein
MGNINFGTHLSVSLSEKKYFMLLTSYPTNLIAHNYILQYVYSDNKFVLIFLKFTTSCRPAKPKMFLFCPVYKTFADPSCRGLHESL